MRIHLHCNAWNDLRMLDFFFRHYEPFVDRFFIHDDGSTDGTLDYLAKRSDVEVRPLERVDAESYVASSLHMYETSWHRSRGQADWVIVTNIDEHVFHPQFERYLAQQTAAGVTAIPALGYQMLTTSFPAADSVLFRDHCIGAPWRQMSKLALFRPDAIEATGYQPGRHIAAPTGRVVYPERDELLNLHYKYLGLDFILARHQEANPRRLAKDVRQGWGHRYSLPADAVAADFAQFASRAQDYRQATDPHRQHTEPRWWRAAW
jgi:Glycosyl transferase family 2